MNEMACGLRPPPGYTTLIPQCEIAVQAKNFCSAYEKEGGNDSAASIALAGCCKMPLPGRAASCGGVVWPPP